jgi:hypothetical protein
MASLNRVVGEFLQKKAGFDELRQAYYEDGSGHLLQRKPGVPGVYDIMTCVQCGVSGRVSPAGVTFGIYLPEGNLRLSGKCNRSLDKDVPDDVMPAYVELFRLYRENDALRGFIPPDARGGSWPKIAIGPWGTPAIKLWDNWSISLDQCRVAIWRRLPDGCGCGFKPCSPRVVLSEDGTARFIRAHGTPYADQSTTPDALDGWEQFKALAMLMYRLPQPVDLRKKWFGRGWGQAVGASQNLVLATGRPVWELWELSGREVAWLEAARGKGDRACRSVSREEYERLKTEHPNAPGIIEVDPSYEDEDTGEWVKVPHEYYEELTTIPAPEIGTQIHFQTGHTSWSSSPFKASVYRATFNGSTWNWEVSQETYAHHLKERVLRLLDADYQPCERPSFDPPCKDWYVTT